MKKILTILALTCSVALGVGGDQPEQKPQAHRKNPTSTPQVTDPVIQPIEVIIEEEPSDHWGLFIKYVLPAIALAAIGGWYAKRKKGGGDEDDDGPTLEDV